MRIRTVVIVALVSVPLVRPALADDPPKLQAYAAACEQERLAAERFYRWKGQVLDDQNALRDLGFQRTSEQLEGIAKDLEQQGREFEEEYNWKKIILDKTLEGVSKLVKAYADTSTPLPLNRKETALLVNELYRTSPKVAAVLDRALKATKTESVIVRGKDLQNLIEAVGEMRERVGKIGETGEKIAGELDRAEAGGNLLVGDGPNSFNGFFTTAKDLAGILPKLAKGGLSPAELGLPELISVFHESATLVRLGIKEAEIDKLLHLNDAERQRLARLADQTKADTNQLRKARADLQLAQNALGGASCDSTKLVKRDEPDGANQAPPPGKDPDTKDAPNDPGKKAGKSGMGAGPKTAIILGTVAGTGVLVTAAAKKAVDSMYSYDSTSSSGGGGSSTASVVRYTTFTCARATGYCSGTITVSIPKPMSSGTMVVYALSNGGDHFYGKSAASSAGTLSVFMDRYFGGGQACSMTLTQVQLFDRDANGSPVYLISASIPVSCQ